MLLAVGTTACILRGFQGLGSWGLTFEVGDQGFGLRLTVGVLVQNSGLSGLSDEQRGVFMFGLPGGGASLVSLRARDQWRSVP